MQGLFDKLNEETEELREQLQKFPEPGPPTEGTVSCWFGKTAHPRRIRARLESTKLAICFFVLVNIARLTLSLDFRVGRLKRQITQIQAAVPSGWKRASAPLWTRALRSNRR